MTINTNPSDKYLLSVNSSLIHLNSLNKLIIWLFTEISGGFQAKALAKKNLAVR